ncbi:hypothetical protein [Flavobacterium sp. W21_SRS_FM6]|uniref:hypothetical protein n=1 Tax=Flavobacterium sp. W21_SRS_FM6 TaxID=3240268 RepID=UPI003F90EB92
MKNKVAVLLILSVIIYFMYVYWGQDANKELNLSESVVTVEPQPPNSQKKAPQITPEFHVTESSEERLEPNKIRSGMSVIPGRDENDDEISLFESGSYLDGVIFLGEPLYDYVIPSWDGSSKYIRSPLYKIEVSVINGIPRAIILENEEYREINSVDFDTGVANDIHRLLESQTSGADSPQKKEYIYDLINSIPQELGYFSVRTLHCKEKECILFTDISSKEASDDFRAKVNENAARVDIFFTTEDGLLAEFRIKFN